MNRRLSLGLAVACFGIIAIGCGSAPKTLDGVWVQDGEMPQTMSIAGDKYTNNVSVMGNTIAVAGKIAYDDKSQSAKITELSVSAAGLPDMVLNQIKKSMPSELEVTVSWKNNDEIVMTPKGQAVPTGAAGTFKRQK